jgi:hypothetical protein
MLLAADLACPSPALPDTHRNQPMSGLRNHTRGRTEAERSAEVGSFWLPGAFRPARAAHPAHAASTVKPGSMGAPLPRQRLGVRQSSGALARDAGERPGGSFSWGESGGGPPHSRTLARPPGTRGPRASSGGPPELLSQTRRALKTSTLVGRRPCGAFGLRTKRWLRRSVALPEWKFCQRPTLHKVSGGKELVRRGFRRAAENGTPAACAPQA